MKIHGGAFGQPLLNGPREEQSSVLALAKMEAMLTGLGPAEEPLPGKEQRRNFLSANVIAVGEFMFIMSFQISC